MTTVPTSFTTIDPLAAAIAPVDDFRQHLSRLSLEAPVLGTAQQFHKLVRSRTGAVSSFEVGFSPDGQAHIDRAWSRGQLGGHARYREQVIEWCQAAQKSGSLQVGNIDGYELTTYCAPVHCFNEIQNVWVFIVPKNEKTRVAVTRVIECATAYYGLWRERFSAIKAEKHAAEMAEIIDLVAAAHRCETVGEACRALAAGLRERSGIEVVALLVGDQSEHKLEAISGLALFDSQGKTVIAFREVGLEALFHPDGAHWPPKDDDAQHCLLAHRRLAESIQAEYVESLPLKLQDGTIVGAMIWAGQIQPGDDETHANFFAAVSLVIAEAIAHLRRMQRGPWLNAWRRLQTESYKKKRKIAMWASFALCVAMLIPIPYKVRCTCQVEPVTRRFAVAPYDGTVERGFVKSGDLVRKDQVLARMDPRELEWELQGVIAEQSRSSKESDVYLTDEQVPEAMMARFDAQRLASRRHMLEHRQSSLEITAPIDGFVLSGDLELNQNAPVKMGDTLYEIGPASPIKVQLQIPADEVRLIKVEHKASIWISGLGARPMVGKIVRVLPRSQVLDGKNVFTAEVEIDNPNAMIRPGMKGIARVTCDYSLLGWNLFHKPWEYLASRLSW